MRPLLVSTWAKVRVPRGLACNLHLGSLCGRAKELVHYLLALLGHGDLSDAVGSGADLVLEQLLLVQVVVQFQTVLVFVHILKHVLNVVLQHYAIMNVPACLGIEQVLDLLH